MTASRVGRVPVRTTARRSIASGALVGIGVAGFIDEVFFHQLLHWHHFYDRSTPTVGLVSDGYFHAVAWLAVVIGLLLFADLQRRHALVSKQWWAGVLLGCGGFQLYDGTIQHKVLRLHQIRYDANLVPYDLTWNIVAAIFIVIGVVLLRSRAASIPPKREEPADAGRAGSVDT